MTGRRPRLDPATARIRNALRAHCRPSGAPALVVAVSGGADSLALAAAAAFLHRRGEGRFLACTVDHGLQPGSAEVAARVVARVEALGLPITSVTTAVAENHPGGLEAAARSGRYSALAGVAAGAHTGGILPDHEAHPARPGYGVIPQIVTGHTRDDQAETVLLGLLRGSGARSLSGMAPRTRFGTANGPIEIVRPLLGVTRDETRASCAAQGLDVWNDPMNDDTRFTRVRARRTLELLTDSLGQDPRAGLVRSADLLREDADHLDAEAEAAWAGLLASANEDGSAPATLGVRDLTAFSPSVISRILRLWLVARGVSAGELTADHVRAVRQVAAASGAVRPEASVPGGGSVRRIRDRILHVEPGREDQGRP
ncbi:tRNA lysidine(34) synthetase TilS [Brevibacterium jeotgali]|uniref:tRNA(Ile)-lysidine synthase n=1 Tax=Brevibacterium jeotgali TaxID=1262550 RepID=A0A2H1L0Z2_9MICO|nr:tRNA lysidine(34) synthetase TilS [Brevibacterium jeotgali]TWC02072.1 tRNA(Ile)-lysidine synthase [Brevibacterium jeotgali]SMY10577.1 tRNA(Ile)-lysidine synthase [Brevibacterium jeotgali]